MPDYLRPSRGPDPRFWEALHAGVVDGFKRDFAMFPDRAHAARNRAADVSRHVAEQLGSTGLAGLIGAVQERKLRQAWSWSAFDYSVKLPSDRGVEVVDASVLAAPALARLAENGRNFADLRDYTEQCALAMRLHRDMSGLGQIITPSHAFTQDFEAVTREPLPPSHEY